MKKYIFPLCLVSLLAHADGDVIKTGSVRIDNGAARAASVHIGCSSDPHGGAIVVEIVVPDANTKKDFGYDDFEGPDSPAGKLSHVEWISGARATSVTTAAAGSYIPDPAEAFQFEMAELAHRKSAPATLLTGADGAPAKLVWTQSSYDKSKRTLVATFDFDAADAASVHDKVAACLPKAR